MRNYPTPPTSAAEEQAREIRDRNGDDRHAVQEIARRLGHVEVGVIQTASGRRWFAYCSCGWASNTAATDVVATQSAVHHVTTSVKKWHQTGKVLGPEPTGPVVIPWAQMARRHRHVEEWLASTRSSDRMVS